MSLTRRLFGLRALGAAALVPLPAAAQALPATFRINCRHTISVDAINRLELVGFEKGADFGWLEVVLKDGSVVQSEIFGHPAFPPDPQDPDPRDLKAAIDAALGLGGGA